MAPSRFSASCATDQAAIRVDFDELTGLATAWGYGRMTKTGARRRGLWGPNSDGHGLGCPAKQALGDWSLSSKAFFIWTSRLGACKSRRRHGRVTEAGSLDYHSEREGGDNRQSDITQTRTHTHTQANPKNKQHEQEWSSLNFFGLLGVSWRFHWSAGGQLVCDLRRRFVGSISCGGPLILHSAGAL